MKTSILTSLVTAMSFFFAGNTLLPSDADEILNRMSDVLFAAVDQESTVTMILTDRNGNERKREAIAWQKGTNKRLFRFTAPASEAGIAFLSLPDDVIYLYMPAYGRERRIASHVKNQSFAGTDFSYEDLEARKYSEDFSATLAEETDDHYVLELIPLPETRSDYSKIVVHVNKEHYHPETMLTYDRGGQEFKLIENTFDRIDNYWFTREIFIKNLKRDHSTRMIFDNVQFDTGLDDDIFSVRNLTRY